MVLVLVIVLIWDQDFENVFPAREMLQTITKTMGIQVIDIVGPQPEGLCINSVTSLIFHIILLTCFSFFFWGPLVPAPGYGTDLLDGQFCIKKMKKRTNSCWCPLTPYWLCLALLLLELLEPPPPEGMWRGEGEGWGRWEGWPLMFQWDVILCIV